MHNTNYITNIKGVSPTCFGINVPSSGRTKCQFLKAVICKVLQSVAASLLMLTYEHYK